jgi:hypothetical protein
MVVCKLLHQILHDSRGLPIGDQAPLGEPLKPPPNRNTYFGISLLRPKLRAGLLVWCLQKCVLRCFP